MKISLYLDEDAQDNDLVHALRLHNVDVVKAWDVGLREREDEEHLLFATEKGRVLYGFNAGDYQRLHTEFLTQGRSHAGIVLAKQQVYSIGELMRRLLKLIAMKSAEEMTDCFDHL